MRATANGGVPAGSDGAQIERAQDVPGRKDQLGGDDILTQRADVRPGRQGFPQADAVRVARVGGGCAGVVQRLDVLDRNDGVGPIRQRVARIDIGGLLANQQGDRAGGRGPG